MKPVVNIVYLLHLMGVAFRSDWPKMPIPQRTEVDLLMDAARAAVAKNHRAMMERQRQLTQ